jgi:glycosyltransferase involved in cell wall biosynthesis
MYDPGHFLPNYLSGLSGAMQETGANVRVISSRPLFEEREETDTRTHDFLFFPMLRGGRLRFLRHRRILRRAVKVISYPAGLARTWLALRTGAPGVLHAQWAPLALFDGWLFRALRRKGWTVVYTAHDPPPDPRARRLAALRYQWMLRPAGAVVVHTKAEAEKFAQRNPKLASRIHVIAHGASVQDPVAAADIADGRSYIGVESDREVILLFGLMKSYKGIEYAIAAMPSVLQQFPRALLVIAGEPLVETQRFRNLIAQLGLEENVLFRPRFVPENEVRKYLAAADLLVTPYTSIGTSGVVILAQSYGLPVIVTRVGGLPEYVERNCAGFVVPPRDSARLAEAICRGLSDRAELAAMGRRGRQTLAREHRWSQVADATLDLYRRLLVPVEVREMNARAIAVNQ